MTPSQLRVFLAVADTLALRSAAKQLDVSQPAVTKTIRELEKQLGVALLVRHPKGVSLTECGIAFRHHATSLLEDMRRTRENLLAISEGASPTITVLTSSVIALTILPSTIEIFSEIAPTAQINLIDGAMPNALSYLRDGTVDLLLVHSPGDAVFEEFSCLPLFNSGWAACTRDGGLYANNVSLGQLLTATWIYPKDNLHSFERTFLDRGFAVPSRIIRSQSFIAALGLLRETDSIVFFLNVIVDSILRPLGVTRIPVAERLPEAWCMAVTRKGAPLTRATALFLQCAQKAAANFSRGATGI